MIVLNIHRHQIPANAINIMRPNLLGNPYKITKAISRAQAILNFKKYAWNSQQIREAIFNLTYDDILVCCCKPLPCHGDIIMEMWEILHTMAKKGK